MSAKLQALIRQLFTTEDLARFEEDLLLFGDRAVVPLLEVLENREYWNEDAIGGGVAPAKAARLLGRLRAPQAVGPLLEALEVLDPLDVLYTAVIHALAEFGEPIYEAVLEEAMPARDENRDYHEALTNVLAECGARDPRILDELRVVLQRNPMLGASYLGVYGDPAAVPDLAAALESDLGTGLRREMRVDEITAALSKLGAPPSAPPPAPPERAMPARNATCWCGSGRKYKACHLDADRA